MAVLALIPLPGLAYAVVKKDDAGNIIDTLFEGPLEDAQAFAASAAATLGLALEELGADILEGLKSVGSNLGNATLQVVEYAGPALVDGIENTYDYIRGKLQGREPDIIAAITVGALAVLAGVYLFNAAKRGTMTYTE